MEIPGKKIAERIETLLKREVRKTKKPITLVAFLVGTSAEQLSFIRIKSKTAKRIGIRFETVHLKKIPSFEDFMHKIKEKSLDPAVTGIIIQQPLPSQLSTDSIYDYIPDVKEIEGHKRKTPFIPPIGLAVLTVLKYIFGSGKISDDLLIDLKKDKDVFKRFLKNKRIVLVGRGVTGGLPIGKTLSLVKLNYIGINSETPEPDSYLKDADVIITAVGKKVIHPGFIKQDVVLLNVGLRREGTKLKGDYDEKEVKNIARVYTPTPGGVGPIDVLYLYHNLIQAAHLQK